MTDIEKAALKKKVLFDIIWIIIVIGMFFFLKYKHSSGEIKQPKSIGYLGKYSVKGVNFKSNDMIKIGKTVFAKIKEDSCENICSITNSEGTKECDALLHLQIGEKEVFWSCEELLNK